MKETSIGIVVDILTEEPAKWREGVRRARELPGLGHVELWLEHTPSRSGLAELNALLDGVDVTVHAPFVDLNLSTSWRELGDLALVRTRRAVEAADELRAGCVTLHAGKYAVYESHQEAVERFATRLSRISDGADALIAVENVKAKQSGVSRETIATSDDFAELLRAYPHAVLTVDAAHALQNQDDPSTMIVEFADRIIGVHVHDTDGRGPSHRALGDGAVDLEAVAQAIGSVKPRYVTLEILGAPETQRSWQTLHQRLGRAGTSTLVG